ncbi:MAG: hypothetical protein ABIZ05_16190 [Pseudonocardiaceae bacterium]
MRWRAALDQARAIVGALDREGAIARALVMAHDRDLNLDLASALQVARTLASALDLDRDRVLDQARDLVGGLVDELANAIDSDYPLHRTHARDRAAVIARDLAQALDRAQRSVMDGDCAPDRAAGPGLDLSRDLASALASYHDLFRALANYPALERDRDIASDFARYRDVAQDLARYLDGHSATPGEVEAEGGRAMPRTVRVAVWLLPRSWQPRYEEEYRAELAGLRHYARNEYAWKVLVKTPQQCWELWGTECPPDRARAEE